MGGTQSPTSIVDQFSATGDAADQSNLPAGRTASPPSSPGANPPAAANPPTATSSPAAPSSDTTAPTVVRPVRRSGIAGLVDEMRDALAGESRAKLFRDEDGNEYVRHQDESGASKWFRIAATAIRGAAAGEAAGPGPAGRARAFAAGVQAGDEQTEARNKREAQLSEEAKQANADHFNSIKLKHDQAAWEFEMGRAKIKATQDDINFAQGQLDREQKLVDDGKSADLGVFKDEADLARVKNAVPDFWKKVYGENSIAVVPEIDQTTGERTGIHLFMHVPGLGSEIMPAGTPLTVITGHKDNGEPILGSIVPSGPVTRLQQQTYETAAYVEHQAWMVNQAKLEHENAGTEHEKVATEAASTEGPLHTAETNKANAEAGEATARTQQIKQETANASPGGLADDIIDGKIVPERLGYLLGKKEGQQILDAIVQRAHDRGITIDMAKLQSYPKVYEQFTSTKPGTAGYALNAGGTALEHLEELSQLNTVASRIPGTPAYKAYHNKLDTLAPELVKFYGMPDTDQSINALKSTLGGVGFRDRGIRTQAHSLGDKLENYRQQWKNAAPSAAYEASMPGLSDASKLARAELDPDYAKHLFSVSKYKAANPTRDVEDARKRAIAAGMDVIE